VFIAAIVIEKLLVINAAKSMKVRLVVFGSLNCD
jgi:hypothetical protein